jgi:ribosomal protein S18 acetylase RimI-like enzyme
MRDITACIDRIDTNLFELIKYAATQTGRHCHEGQSYSYVSFAPSPWINAVFALDLDGLGEAREIARLIVSGTLPNRIILGPTSKPANIGALLTSAGFIARPAARGMILDMAKRRSLCAPEGCALRFFSPRDDHFAWAAVVAENLFDAPRDSGGSAFAELVCAIEGPRAFAAGLLRGGTLVSTCFAFIDGEGVGGIYFVATEKEYRRRGYGAAVVSAVLEELSARGVETCILHASALGEPVYKSLGFVGLCDLGRYALGEAASAGVR